MQTTPGRLFHNICAVLVIACGLALPGAARADLIALKLPGVVGTVTVAGYQGAIEVLSLTGEVESPTTGSVTGAPGAEAGKPTFGDLMIHKRFDTTSPALFRAVVTGSHFPSAVITFLQQTTAGKLTKIFTITLSEVLVTKFATDATEPHVLAGPEQVNLAYEKIVLRDEVTGTTACFNRLTDTTC